MIKFAQTMGIGEDDYCDELDVNDDLWFIQFN